MLLSCGVGKRRSRKRFARRFALEFRIQWPEEGWWKHGSMTDLRATKPATNVIIPWVLAPRESYVPPVPGLDAEIGSECDKASPHSNAVHKTMKDDQIQDTQLGSIRLAGWLYLYSSLAGWLLRWWLASWVAGRDRSLQCRSLRCGPVVKNQSVGITWGFPPKAKSTLFKRLWDYI